ncbi:hypothetical protein [Streptomyces longwoodensis]|uniref:hypothetical protein n=1 Tax=Streptomyces longwoodensis TaxID=68231 RepID=UPI00224EFF21|nr:hypothetical protein [Streptomyces longwoodensis]MCX4999057.1 hypothetical protein [Streptomyces longwoodensis]WTI47823.1 hypothetical protein OG547_26555 [Streptomyces longwoodensis]
MTSRIPRDSRLRLVRPRPLAAAPSAVNQRRPRRPAPRPPEGTPAPAELARMARSGLAPAARVARWADAALGPGSEAATADGKATLADATAERAARDLGLTADRVRADWDTARLAGLIEVHGDSARPGWRLRAWDRDDSAVLRGWVALFDAWSLATPEPGDQEAATVAEVVSAMPQVLSFLQLSAGPVPVDQLLDLLRQRVTELRTERCEVVYDADAADAGAAAPDAPARPALAAAAGPAESEGEPADPARAAELAPLLDWALHALASVGALTYGDGQATLTPLGSWAVWVKLEQICVAAQSPAGNIEQPAEDMLRGCAQLRPNAARAEYRAWLAARPVGSAVTELLAAARGEDALLRGLAFEALRVVGAPAEPDVRAVVEEPALRPYALLWLAEHDGVDPEDAHEVLTREEATWLWVDTAAAVADHGEAPMLVRHLESALQPTVPALLKEVRAAGHPRTVQVLVALAAAHPDPALAKAVRRAAFQVHTGGH